MAKTKQTIISEITNHFNGIPYSNSYVGITSNVDNRLFGDHKVSKSSDHWIHRAAESDTIARDIESHFLALGMDGGSGGGDGSSKIVYAYKKNGHTNP